MIRTIFMPPKPYGTDHRKNRSCLGLALGAVMLFLFLAGGLGCTHGNGESSSGSTSPSFNISASPGGLQVPAGGSGYAVVSVTRVNGFAGDIALSMTGLPTGVIVSGSIPEGEPSGRLTIAVAADVAPQSWVDLTLDGQAGTLHRTSGFSLTVAPPLPASNLSPNLVNASGGPQKNGTLENTAFAMEPVPHEVSSDSSGVTAVRHGFLPEPTPSNP